MPLTKPSLTPVIAGQPLTAQAWNELLDGLGKLYDAVLALGTGRLEVSVAFQGSPVAGARVTAEPVGEGQPVEAVAPFAGRTTYLLLGVTDGNWRVHVRAAGFADQSIEVPLPRTDPLPVNLARAGSVVPDVFGVGLKTALTTIGNAGLDVELVFDTTGQEVPRANLIPEYVEAPVLVQTPGAGQVVAPAGPRVRLVVASPLRREPVVTLPNLIGLTYTEAATTLQQLGLNVGKSEVKSTQATLIRRPS